MNKNPKSSKAGGIPVGEPAGPLASLRERLVRAPARALLAVAAILLIAESVGAHALFDWWPALKQVEPLIEAALALGIVLPVLVLLFVLPSALDLRRREAAESALRAERETLAVRVHERTAELEESNRQLRQESEDRQRAQQAATFQAGLLDAVHQAVTATDREGRVLYWNRFAEDLYGWAAAEVKGRSLREVVAFTRPDGQPLDVLDAPGEGVSCTGEAEAVRRDGTRFPVYLSCSRLPGEMDGHLFVSFDLTELKQAEEALRESEAKYSNLVESSPTGIFIFWKDKLLFVNPRFAGLLGCSRESLLEADPWLLVHPEDRDRMAELARKRVEGEQVPEEYECRLVTCSGEVRWVAMRNTLIRYRGGVAILGNVQDVTDRRRMEAQLHQLSARLLTIQEEERRRVARDLHDSLGQRLTGIKFLVEASLGKPWPAERRWGMGQLRNLIPTIQDIVEEVRRLSTELRPSILDDLGLLPTIAWHLREFEKARPGVAVEQRLGAAESEVPDALRTPIFRILQEASNNVAKHSGASRLVVGLETGDGRLRLWVQDDGVGFDPGAPSRESGNGGIGMGSMRERAELTGGAFTVSSAPGAGTTVRADWPLESPVSA